MTDDEGELFRAFIEDGEMLFAAVDYDGTIRYASPVVRLLLGYEPEELVGTNVVSLLHPDDLDRAVYQLGSAAGSSPAPGLSRFGVRHADGSYRPIEAMASKISPHGEDLLGLYLRGGMHQGFVIQRTLELLLQGASREEALESVCDVVQWRRVGSRVAVSWFDDVGTHTLTEDLAPPLTGGDSDPNTPWAHCRSQGSEVSGDLTTLDAERRDLAAASGLDRFWIVPIEWSTVYPPATATVWTRADGHAPIVHAFGISNLQNVVALTLRWTEQLRELGLAARSDPLTGLANRRTFYEALQGDDVGGAVLFCDLDRFKPVNDEFGHVVGDDVLRLVARRLIASSRDGDVVARDRGRRVRRAVRRRRGGRGARDRRAHPSRTRAALPHRRAPGDDRGERRGRRRRVEPERHLARRRRPGARCRQARRRGVGPPARARRARGAAARVAGRRAPRRRGARRGRPRTPVRRAARYRSAGTSSARRSASHGARMAQRRKWSFTIPRACMAA